MIREILTYLFEKPTLKSAKKFGHLTESISLVERQKRCASAWLPHRTQCKNFIKNHLKIASSFDSVLVLGSGPLHEIPIEELCRTFKKVTLVDIVHLSSTKKSVAHLKNIEFIEHDISEIESFLLNQQMIAKRPERFIDENFSLVLSVNIMSQLPIHIGTFIEKNLSGHLKENELESFLKTLTKNHLDYLELFKTPSLLITDVETHFYDRFQKIIQVDKNYEHLTLPKPSQSWDWNVAPIPEFQKDIGIKMKVCAYILNHENTH